MYVTFFLVLIPYLVAFYFFFIRGVIMVMIDSTSFKFACSRDTWYEEDKRLCFLNASGSSIGIISIGQISCGLIAIGQMSFGLVTLGQVSVGFIYVIAAQVCLSGVNLLSMASVSLIYTSFTMIATSPLGKLINKKKKCYAVMCR